MFSISIINSPNRQIDRYANKRKKKNIQKPYERTAEPMINHDKESQMKGRFVEFSIHAFIYC